MSARSSRCCATRSNDSRSNTRSHQMRPRRSGDRLDSEEAFGFIRAHQAMYAVTMQYRVLEISPALSTRGRNAFARRTAKPIRCWAIAGPQIPQSVRRPSQLRLRSLCDASTASMTAPDGRALLDCFGAKRRGVAPFPHPPRPAGMLASDRILATRWQIGYGVQLP